MMDKKSNLILGGLTFCLIMTLAAAEKQSYKENFDVSPGGWGGDGSYYSAKGGNPESGGYHQATRETYSPYHQPMFGRSTQALKGDLIERFGNRFNFSVDVKQISGGNKGFIVFIYGKDASGEKTYWSRTILNPGQVPAKWTRISFDVNALDDSEWKRGAGSMNFYDTLRNVSEFMLFGGRGKSSGATVTGIDNVEVKSLESNNGPEPESFNSWKADRKYRVLVDIQKPDKPFPKHMPFSKILEFKKLLKDIGVEETFVPGSVVVTSYDEATGKEKVIPHLMDESFVAKDYGYVSWDIADPSQNRFAIYFDTKGKAAINSGYVQPVGIGDNFRYNRKGGKNPIHTHGIRPATGDVDGDGLVDLISPSIYSSTWGQPEFTFWFWKNVGTNEKPVFADFMRLYDVNGNIIPNEYNNCDLYDWNNDGRLDLVTKKEVYINTGKISKTGMPGFKKLKGATVLQGPSWYTFFIGLRDHDGDGVKDAFFYKLKIHYAYEGNPNRNFVKSTLFFLKNKAGAGERPRFDTTHNEVKIAGKTSHENYLIQNFYDFDGDGKLDCIGEWIPLDKNPSIPMLVYWPNIAKAGKPPVYGKAKVIPNSETYGGATIVPAKNDAFNGLLVQEGHRVRYFARTENSKPGQMPNHQDKGVLKQLGGACGVDGYNGIDVEDWDDDGDWDFITGTEHGFVLLIENIGSNEKPVFDAPVQVKADGKPIRVMRWQYIPDGNCEYYLGQTKPRYVDWDRDGKKDLVLANHTDRILLYRNVGTAKAPVFSKGEIIRTKDSENPFVFRNQPSIVDWDGDGKMDILTRDRGGRLSLYYGTGEKNSLIVKPAKPLLYADGGAIWNHRKDHAPGQWDACDWDSDGDLDIIAQSSKKWGTNGPVLLENVGSNKNPKFKRPKRLTCFGKKISISNHEHSFAVVDWYGQGKYDLVAGGESGLFFFFRRPAMEDAALPKTATSRKLEIRQDD